MDLEFLKTPDTLPVERIATPEWPTCPFVFVRALRADERDAMESAWLALEQGSDKTGFRAHVVACTLCGAEGGLLFSEGDLPAARAALGQKAAAPVNRIFNAACRLNALTESDVEELEKN